MLTQLVGPTAFMYVAIVVAVLYGAFVAWRITRREPVVDEEQEPYQPITGQVPYTDEVSPYAAEEGEH